ncbi:MAG: AAA family ATPase, partial [Schleiferiaceae bacterium]|nr:AAA family ATPase [Schleiferiaceae bacterium]
MLRRLHIERFALIDQLDLIVEPGFTVVTGETGAGKSIFLGALQLALGGRAEFASIGQANHRSLVEAEFSVPQSRESDLGSPEWDWWTDQDKALLVLRREVVPGGRSRAFINDSPVRLDELRRVSASLVDIHSQRDEGLWARSEGVVLLLEAFAHQGQEAREDYGRAWSAYRASANDFTLLESQIGAVSDPEYLRFMVEELRALALKPGEEASLRERLSLLGNQQELSEASAEALSLIEREELGLDSMAAQVRRLGERVARLSPSNEELSAMGFALEDQVRELRARWSDLVERLDSDPMALEIAEERLAAIDRLQRKHQCPDEEALLAHQALLEQRLEVWDAGQERRILAQAAVESALKKVQQAGSAWNQNLMQAEAKLAQAVREGLADLAMPQTQFAVKAELRTAPSAAGTYSYRLEFSANPGQSMQDLAKVASGGERSRLMLVLKRFLAQRQGLSTVLFDEIDTGVSGGTASKMAQMLRSMSRDAQVIAITHLPQVAALG